MYKLGIIGLSPGNGHPYSWSAIFNGYDRQRMREIPFHISSYLDRQDPDTMCIESAGVTHIWTQDPEISRAVARAARIENICDNISDMIGHVDAVLLARDDGENHLEMARPFIEADVPLFIDKPLATSAADLAAFAKYYRAGKPLMSCSSTRYARKIIEAAKDDSIGKILTANAFTSKYWSTYAIHIIEGIYAVMGPGVESVRNVGRAGEEIVHLQYQDGRHAVLQTFKGTDYFPCFSFFGENKCVTFEDTDAFFMFKNTLVHFIEMLDSGKAPVDWRETVETCKIIIAGRMSLEQNGRTVTLDEIQTG